ncbi:MAG: hypothetical protein IJ232_01365 [Lachnospiraceae bacterium]|nr:hypothetical protein [Lachnospiraceae bacterium]
MQELTRMLNDVSDSYYDFVVAMLHYAKKSNHLDIMKKYIIDNPSATTSDIIGFVSDQPDFYEDAAYSKVG